MQKAKRKKYGFSDDFFIHFFGNLNNKEINKQTTEKEIERKRKEVFCL